MGAKQLKNGNRDEDLVVSIFKKHGFWCHNFAKGKTGEQPCDIVALKENQIWLVDVKNVEKGVSFPINRIEANQWACFDYARNFAKIKNLGFVICFERDDLKPFFLEYDKALEMDKTGQKSINMSELKGWEEYL